MNRRAVVRVSKGAAGSRIILSGGKRWNGVQWPEKPANKMGREQKVDLDSVTN
jgi:hypothetical protein